MEEENREEQKKEEYVTTIKGEAYNAHCWMMIFNENPGLNMEKQIVYIWLNVSGTDNPNAFSI